MKKTISITLAGRVFTMEDDGYELLENYLGGLKRHFAKDESAEELMADIEASIGEKFSEKLGSHKEAITIEDVRGMIAVMGELEEITDDDAEETKAQPEPEDETPVAKRLYRDSEDIVIAGVCAGLAAYFGVSPTAMRIIFIVLAFLNGLGIALYLILWAAVPIARTNAQKFEMRGKRLNVDEIEQVVKEKAKKMGEEGKAALERIKTDNQSVFSKILNIPVIIIGAVFRATRAFFRALGPIVSVMIGVTILIGAIAGITFASVTGSMLLFPTNSEYLVSDLPIAEIASQPLYEVGVIATYIFALVPLILLIMLATTLIRRKNSFHVVPVAVLIGLWILSASAGALAARDIGPWAYHRVQEIEESSTVTRTFQETGFTSIVATGNMNVTVKQGEAFEVKAAGISPIVERLNVTQKDGVLTLSSGRTDRGPCLFCFTRRVEAEITLPTLTAYTAKDVTNGRIEGFKEDFTLNAQDASHVEFDLAGQNATATIRDVARVLVTGKTAQFVLNVSDAGRMNAENLVAQSIFVTQSDVSRVYLEGTTEEITANLKDAARLDGGDLEAKRVSLTEKDVSHADINPQEGTLETEETPTTTHETVE